MVNKGPRSNRPGPSSFGELIRAHAAQDAHRRATGRTAPEDALERAGRLEDVDEQRATTNGSARDRRERRSHGPQMAVSTRTGCVASPSAVTRSSWVPTLN